VPIHPDIAARWSPRAFDADAQLDAEEMIAVLEAARWAATWGPVNRCTSSSGCEATGSGLLSCNRPETPNAGPRNRNIGYWQ
jgi:hypothetical protein